MGITLKQGMVLATVIGQHNLSAAILGKKAVFDNNGPVSYDLPFPWLEKQLQELASHSVTTGEFKVVEIKNPQEDQQKLTLMLDPFLPPHELIILGGGHIAQPLAALGKMLGYKVTVVDDREDFVTPERFPEADSRIFCSFDELEEYISPGVRSSVIIVTRGHQHDWLCLRHMLDYPLLYLGVIGSRRKVGILREKMLVEGYTEKDINRVYAPMGIDIGAQTPEEIAISIAAELIKVRRGGKAASLKIGGEEPIPVNTSEVTSSVELNVIEKAIEAACNKIPAALATIITSSGSTPRKAGSRMLVYEDGKIFGTIGGGLGEAQACQEAVKIIASGIPGIFNVTMTADAAADAGMVCGGVLDVFIEPVNELARIFGE